MLPSNPGRRVRQTSYELAKALIIDTTTGTSYPVMYNPEELKFEQGNAFAEVAVPGLNAPPLQYVRGKARVLTMELFFDTYETGEDVRDRTAPIVQLLEKRPAAQAPPVLLFSLGRMQFRCVLVDAGQRFTMFLRDGTPVRSTMSVRLQEYVEAAVDIQRGAFFGTPAVPVAGTVAAATGTAASGAARVHVTVAGDTLSGIAAAYLGDAARWRRIADANRIADPFDLPAGKPLVIPDVGP